MRLANFRRQGPPLRYGAGVVIAASAVFLRMLLDPFVTGVQFITFFPAVMLATYLAGTRTGLVTAVLCGLAGWYFFLEPRNSFAITNSAEAISLTTFMAVSGVMAWAIGGLTLALERERRHLNQQRLLVEELNHRVKNNLSVVQAIARQTLKPEACKPDVRAAFEHRLIALASAHEVLTRRRWEAVELTDLLSNLLRGIGIEKHRLSLGGPPVVVQPKAAITMTLAVHELATNAIKYGALSNESGSVTLRWGEVDGTLHLRWQEAGGPPVLPPTKRGFGTTMVERALAREFGGNVELQFLAQGVICIIDLPLKSSEAVMLS